MNNLQITNLDSSRAERKLNIDKRLPKPPYRMAFVGTSGSGKTNAICNLFTSRFYGDIFKPNHTFIFSPTVDLDPKYKECIPSIHHIDHFDIQIFEEIFRQQDAILKNFGKKRLDHICIILDDLLTDKCLSQHKGLVNYIFKARHYNISIIISVQKWTGIPRTARLNLDNICIFRCTLNEIDNICNDIVDKKNRDQLRSILIHVFETPFAFIKFDFTKPFSKALSFGFDTPIDFSVV